MEEGGSVGERGLSQSEYTLYMYETAKEQTSKFYIENKSERTKYFLKQRCL